MFGHVFSWPQWEIGISPLKLQIIILLKEPFPHQFPLFFCNLCVEVALCVTLCKYCSNRLSHYHWQQSAISPRGWLWLHQSFHHPQRPGHLIYGSQVTTDEKSQSQETGYLIKTPRQQLHVSIVLALMSCAYRNLFIGTNLQENVQLRLYFKDSSANHITVTLNSNMGSSYVHSTLVKV